MLWNVADGPLHIVECRYADGFVGAPAYLAPDGTLMAVDITVAGTLDAGQPRALFHVPISGDIITFRNHYAPTSDGRRFLVDSAGQREAINVVVNWNAMINP